MNDKTEMLSLWFWMGGTEQGYWAHMTVWSEAQLKSVTADIRRGGRVTSTTERSGPPSAKEIYAALYQDEQRASGVCS